MIGYNFPPDPPDYDEPYYESIVCNKCGKDNCNVHQFTASIVKNKCIEYYTWVLCDECIEEMFDEFKIKPDKDVIKDDGKCELPF